MCSSDLGILRLDYTFNNLLVYEFDGKEYKNEKDLYERKWLRGNEGIYWKDTTLQNAGYTYDYFAPQILEDGDVSFRDGEIAPDGPGYRALLLYQEALPYSSALKILEWAKQGLPVVLVNGVTETVHRNTDVTHGRAASKTPFLDGRDEDLAAVIAELKQLSNVRTVDRPADALDALQDLGVVPRARFAEQNAKVLTTLRQDGGMQQSQMAAG